ncbi:MAG: hypothetical protein ABL967_15905 [Bryobacteraceae bacterium]
MSRNTLKEHVRETETRARETSEKLRKMETTEGEGVRTADQTGAVSSELEDIRAELRRAKEPIYASIEQATREDQQQVVEQEKAASAHARELGDLSSKTSSEQTKAEGIRSRDSRIQSGSDLAEILRDTKNQLDSSGRSQSTLASDAGQKRAQSERQTRGAIQRNRSK